MRDGIYKIWVTGRTTRVCGAMLLKGGSLIAVNPAIGFVGRYWLTAGRITCEALCTRLNLASDFGEFPPLDEMHFRAEGLAGPEFASCIGTIAEAPDYSSTLEFTFLCAA